MKKFIKCCLVLLMIFLVTIFGINFIVLNSSHEQIKSEEEITNIEDIDCILVLGAGIWGDEPSPMLKDRLDKAIFLYDHQISSKIVMSGDHGTQEYDEVNVMKDYAKEKNIPSEDIFMDHAGFSTYDSLYRIKEVFEAQKIVIVTQKYHLYRALYIAQQLGIDAYGVPAEDIQYRGALIREAREILARDKDFIKCLIQPEPALLGETIPVSGNGDSTNDK